MSAQINRTRWRLAALLCGGVLLATAMISGCERGCATLGDPEALVGGAYSLVDHHGVAIRTGHHCAMPANRRFGISGSARASLGVYNHQGDIDTLVDALQHAREMLL